MKRWTLALLALGFLAWDITPAFNVAPALASCHEFHKDLRCTTSCSGIEPFRTCKTTCY